MTFCAYYTYRRAFPLKQAQEQDANSLSGATKNEFISVVLVLSLVFKVREEGSAVPSIPVPAICFIEA